MARNRMPRGLVALSASAIAVVYAAGYMHTQSADAALGAVETPTQAATAQVQAAPTPVPTVAPVVAPRRGDDGDFGEGGSGGREGNRRQALGSNPAAPSQRGQPVAPPAQQTPPQQQPGQRTQPAPAPAAGAPSTQAQTAAFKDGTYSGLGRSRRGDVQVSVTVQGGRIANVNITRVTTEYPVRDIANLPGQVVARQSAQVNMVSGATFSSMAFAQAVQQALSQAKTA